MTNLTWSRLERLLRQLGKLELTPTQRRWLVQMRKDIQAKKGEMRQARAHLRKAQEQLRVLSK